MILAIISILLIGSIVVCSLMYISIILGLVSTRLFSFLVVVVGVAVILISWPKMTIGPTFLVFLVILIVFLFKSFVFSLFCGIGPVIGVSSHY